MDMSSTKTLLMSFLMLAVASSSLAQVRRGKGPTAQQNQMTTRQIVGKAYSSTVVVYAHDAKRSMVSTGSGFFVTPNLVATSYHVIEDAEQIQVSLMTYHDMVLTARVFRSDEKSDLALLDVSPFKGVPISLFRGGDLYVGDTVYTLGNPKGLDGTFSNGIISRASESAGIWTIQITAPVSPGSSGGPVLNDHAEVIGIVQSQVKDGQNLNFAIMTSHLLLLINGNSDKPDI